jgi:predicted glycosyltransferase
MRILIYLGHPAQYHFFKNIVNDLKKRHQVRYLIKTKDVLEPLLIADGAEYKNILPEARKATRAGIGWGLLKREVRVLNEALRFRPSLMVGTDPSLTHVGKILGIPVLTVLEDDASVIYDLAKITFPLTSHIVAPDSCDCGKWNSKKISYSGYMKLAYLHPTHFAFENNLWRNRALIRLSSLSAFHDTGIKGFDKPTVKRLIEKLSNDFEVVISSEGVLDHEFDAYSLDINPAEMHRVLSESALLISDSQSMTMEAAMLGVPSIRYSDFAGRIGVLEELEHTYQLTFGIKPGNLAGLFEKLDELVNMPNLFDEFQMRRKRMLADKIDVTAFMVWLIEHYPESMRVLREEPEYQYRFRSADYAD